MQNTPMRAALFVFATAACHAERVPSDSAVEATTISSATADAGPTLAPTSLQITKK